MRVLLVQLFDCLSEGELLPVLVMYQVELQRELNLPLPG